MKSRELKTPLSIAEQRSKLASHGIRFSKYDEKKVEQILFRANYYRITGYALQFRKKRSESDCIEGTEFGDILQIYYFDAALRHLLLRYIEPVEVKFRTVVAYTVSINHCKSAPHNQHLDISSYYRKEDAGKILDKFYEEESYEERPIFVQHHSEKYGGDAPLWVMVETMPFSRLAKYYNCLLNKDKKTIAQGFGAAPDNLYNAICCIVRLRNESAHGDRLYNTAYRREARLTYTAHKKVVKSNSFFAYLLVLCRYLPTVELRTNLIREFSKLLDQYDDNIVRRDLLGIPENGLRLMNAFLH